MAALVRTVLHAISDLTQLRIPSLDFLGFLDNDVECDDLAPAKYFVFGVILGGIPSLIVALLEAPNDAALSCGIVAGCVFHGGGCAAMFALGRRVFRTVFAVSVKLTLLVLPISLLLKGASELMLLVWFGIWLLIMSTCAAVYAIFIGIRWARQHFDVSQ